MNYCHIAVISDQPDIMENLLYFGLPSDERCSHGNHLLHYAASNNSDRCITRFWDIQQGQERLALPVNSDGRTPLHILSFNSPNDALNTPQNEYKDLETFLCFLRGNPFLNTRDRFGRTVLHYAAWSNRIGMVRLLLERGADRSIQDYQGLIPIQYTGMDSAINELLRNTYPGIPSPGPSTPVPVDNNVPAANPDDAVDVPVVVADLQAEEELPPSPLLPIHVSVPDGFDIEFLHDSEVEDDVDPISFA